MSDFFSAGGGTARQYKARAPIFAGAVDRIYDLGLKLSGGLRALRRRAAAQPQRNILIVGVETPGALGEIFNVITRLTKSRHRSVVSVTPMADRGKFINIDAAIAAAAAPLESFDWLIITDDDISFKPGFLDDFLAAAEAADLALCQPAHLFNSHASYDVTRRRWGALVRQTRFVEIGPLTAMRRETFADLIPFPASRWSYGIDVLWASLAEARGWKIGVIDATPIAHLRPVGATYSTAAAHEEGRELLAAHNVTLVRESLLAEHSIALSWYVRWKRATSDSLCE